MTTKKFDLESAKRGEPVVTLCGFPARIVCFDLKAPKEHDTPLAVLIELPGVLEACFALDADGRFDHNPDHRFTLVMVTT